MGTTKTLLFAAHLFFCFGCGLPQISNRQLPLDLAIKNTRPVLLNYERPDKNGSPKEHIIPADCVLFEHLRSVLKKKGHPSLVTYAPTYYLIVIGNDTINIHPTAIIFNLKRRQFVIPITKNEGEEIFAECKKLTKDGESGTPDP